MRYLKKVARWSLLLFGITAIAMIALAFTDVPYFAYHKLGTHCEPLEKNPEVIVVLGGSGMPSADGLIRTYYAAEAANKFPSSEIIIAHPFDNDSMNTYQLDLMKKELVIRGVDSLRICYKPYGHNTHSQAINVAELLKDKLDYSSVLIITTPEHMFRSIRAFQKAGLKHVGGLPSFEIPISERKLRGRTEEEKKEVGLSWRYNVWSYLKYELLVLREYFAIAYYKFKGWI